MDFTVSPHLPKMNFHRGTAQQLADFLRSQIAQGELFNPLPSTRVWCQQLGVGRPNLLRALRILEHDHLLSIRPRGVIISSPVRHRPKTPAPRRAVRFLFPGRHYPDMGTNVRWLFLLSEGLHERGISFTIEPCSTNRLQSIAREPGDPDALYLLGSLPTALQELFLENQVPAIVTGYAGAEVPLPFLTPDLGGAVRHAALRMLRQGIRHLVLVNVPSQASGVEECIRQFKEACAQWRHQPVKAEVELIWNDPSSMRNSFSRLASRVKERCGFIVFSPVPIGVLVTSLLEKGISIPDQVEIAGIEYSSREIQFSVPVTLYELPSDQFAKILLRKILFYFDSGQPPSLNKVVMMNETRWD